MGSSDYDFLWTDASTSSEDKTMAPDTVNGESSDYESEKSYKKKLQKKLRRESTGTTIEHRVKLELLNEAAVKREPESERESSQPSPDPTLDHQELNGDDNDSYYDQVESEKLKKNKIKEEKDRESLNYSETGEYKITIEENNIEYSLQERDDSLNYNDQVKVKKSKKKKIKKEKDRGTLDYSDTVEDNISIEENNIEYSLQEKSDNDRHNDQVEPEKSKKKKLKKDKDRESVNYSDIVVDKISIIENNIEHSTQERNLSDHEINGDLDIGEISKNSIKSKKKKRNRKETTTEEKDTEMNNDSFNDITEKRNSDVDNDNTGIFNESKVTYSVPKNYKRISNLSNCIQFEDENREESDDENNKAMSNKVKKYLKANTHLHPVAIKSDFESLSHDDLWLLTCPHDIDLASFKETDFTLDSKCKIKIENQTFVGNLNESSKLGMLVLEHKKPVIKNVLLQGTINLHKRIPKAHVAEDNVTASNQIEYIPLPETKCRHPLFGTEYKNAIKLPKSVKERLKESTVAEESTTDGKKKKKKKKHENDDDSLLLEPVFTEVRKEKKSRKRRQTEGADDDGEQPAPSKRRRVKQEPDADTWDSAKAIEESLFNF